MNAMLKETASGPLAGSAEGFARYLTGLGYAPGSVVLRLNLLKHLSRWLTAERIDPDDFDSAAAERFVAARRLDHVDLSSARALAPLLAFLRSAGTIPAPTAPAARETAVDMVLARWGDFLVTERGLKAATIQYYRELTRPFLLSRVRGDMVDIDGLDAQTVSMFVRERIPGMPVGNAKLTVTALRSLLWFLFITGLISQRLDTVVLARAGYRDSGLPRGLARAEVTALISAIDLTARTGKRDRAIVMLLARLGLRAAEVAALTLDDIDWRVATLRVPGKDDRIDMLPIPADVGEALAGHLAVGRHPAAVGRALFFGSVAPYLPLSTSAVIAVVRNAGQRAGLGPVGAHRLRHSVATVTINAGASLEEVAQLLRHRSLTSTTIYAKIDITRLAVLARPWSGAPAGDRDGGTQ